jgi:redox-sensitive bicupin YhaK (pirin superfamily)
MIYRNILSQTISREFQMGPMKIKQPLPDKSLEQVSPFLLLHHAGPEHHAPASPATRLNPHPHRGFEPVTFIFSGKMHHKDSLGSEGFLQSGDVQWMTGGSGIIHSEGPSKEFFREGGTMEIIQLWVNLPRAFKMTQPKYQDIKKEQIPQIVEDDGKVKLDLVAGSLNGYLGPATTFTPIVALMGHFRQGGSTILHIPANYNALIYVLDGQMKSNGVIIDAVHLAVFDHNSDQIRLEAGRDSKILFLAGQPINEPVASYGPFVMNYPGEIKQAITDYETGKMGVLES